MNLLEFLPTLAFGFASPLLVWGALLGGIPILLHLLHRRKHRETPWAAMRFLLAAVKRNQRRIRLEQLLLLAVRVLILSLAGLAFAQPFAESFGKIYQVSTPTHRVLVLDASFSMGLQGADGPAFDRAKSLAREIVTRTRQGDAVSLLRVCQQAPRSIVGRPSYQKQPVLAELDQLTLTDEPGDLLVTLKEAVDALGRAPELPRKEVYFLSDFQAATWGGDAGGGRAAIQAAFQKIGESAEIVLLDVGDDAATNGAVVGWDVVEPSVAVGKSVTFHGTLRNFGSAALPGQLLEMLVDERVVESRKVDLPAGGPLRETFQYTFSTAGEHDVELRLAADRLPVDNRRWLALPVRDTTNVLLVNGRPAGKPQDTATWYLEKALAPSTGKQRWPGAVLPKVISESELASTELSKFDCVVLCDIRLITDREANVLKTFVAAGGGLIVCPSGRTQPDNYNQLLGSEGVDLLPGKFVGRMGGAKGSVNPSGANPGAATPGGADDVATFEFETSDLSHPVVRPFQGNPGTGLEATLTFQYLRIEPRKDEATRTILKFDTGDPVLVERAVGRGRVLLFATSADVVWSTWAIQRSFPPIVHEAVQHVVAGRWAERRRVVGEPITRVFSQIPAGMSVNVVGPDGRKAAAAVIDERTLSTATFDATDRAGLYELSAAAPVSLTETYAVNLDARESDPTRVGPSELREDLLTGVEFDYRTEDVDRAGGILSDHAAPRGGLSRGLLLICLALALIEPLLAWRFRAGAMALGTVLIAALVGVTWGTGPAVGVAVILAMMATSFGLSRGGTAR